MIVLLTKDLFFVPVVKSAAENCEQDFLSIRTVDDERLAEHDGQVVGALVDLASVSLADLATIYSGLAKCSDGAVLCAFGSHVHANRLEAAREAGFDPVLTRGQLDASLGELMGKWCSKSG